MTFFHPRLDDAGQPVAILRPSMATPAAAWADPGAVVVVVPDGEVPAALNGVPFAPWQPPAAGWRDGEAARRPIAEPPFTPPAGLAPAAGVVLVEPDARVWLAQPSNAYGARFTIPKGRVDPGASLAGTALREAWEEVGLRARLTGFLGDFSRSVTHVRVYVGERADGHPGAMHWESQGVLLVPPSRLGDFLDGPFDAPLVAAILAHLG